MSLALRLAAPLLLPPDLRYRGKRRRDRRSQSPNLCLLVFVSLTWSAEVRCYCRRCGREGNRGRRFEPVSYQSAVLEGESKNCSSQADLSSWCFGFCSG